MYYKIKKSVTPAKLDEVGIYAVHYSPLKTAVFEITDERPGGFGPGSPHTGKPTVTTIHGNRDVGGWRIPLSFLQPVRAARPKKSSKATKSKSKK